MPMFQNPRQLYVPGLNVAMHYCLGLAVNQDNIKFPFIINSLTESESEL